jgi:hypothetical protein
VLRRYCELAGVVYNPYESYTDGITRHDKNLVQAFEEYIETDPETDIRIREIKGNKYIINEYDGWETVFEPHEIEWITI